MESVDMHEWFQTELGSGPPVPKFSFSPCFCSVMDSDPGFCYFCHFTVPFPFWRDRETSTSLILIHMVWGRLTSRPRIMTLHIDLNVAHLYIVPASGPHWLALKIVLKVRRWDLILRPTLKLLGGYKLFYSCRENSMKVWTGDSDFSTKKVGGGEGECCLTTDPTQRISRRKRWRVPTLCSDSLGSVHSLSLFHTDQLCHFKLIQIHSA